MSTLISSSSKHFGELFLDYDEFHRLHICHLRKMLLAEYKKKGRDLNNIGKKLTLFLKSKFRPILAMCKIKSKDELKIHIKNLLTLISASTYNNHVADGLVNGKPTMNITLALGFRLDEDDIICDTDNESLTHQQDALFSLQRR